jgi:hypothetical protein
VPSPKLERYRRRESSVEEALIKMYRAGVSVRRVEDITEALWGTRVSPSTVSELNEKIYGTIETWRNRHPINGVRVGPSPGTRSPTFYVIVSTLARVNNRPFSITNLFEATRQGSEAQ